MSNRGGLLFLHFWGTWTISVVCTGGDWWWVHSILGEQVGSWGLPNDGSWGLSSKSLIYTQAAPVLLRKCVSFLQKRVLPTFVDVVVGSRQELQRQL